MVCYGVVSCFIWGGGLVLKIDNSIVKKKRDNSHNITNDENCHNSQFSLLVF